MRPSAPVPRPLGSFPSFAALSATSLFALAALASHTATYPEHPEITPGAERLFNISVPSGPHKVAILLDGTTASGGALRIQVNQKQLNPGKKPAGSATSRG